VLDPMSIRHQRARNHSRYGASGSMARAADAATPARRRGSAHASKSALAP
jgi:hypothetical protein